MKRVIFSAIAAAVASSAVAQSAIDAFTVSQNELRGTARFMSMAGAFGALGGDLSTLNQNPAGIGIYRSSEIGITADFSFQSSKSAGSTAGYDKMDQTKVYCNNFGYVGSVRLNNSVMSYFNWGASYSRAVSFDHVYQGNFASLGSSLTNYVADYTTASKWNPSMLSQYNDKGVYDPGAYNPYQYVDYDLSGGRTFIPWSSILFYNNYLIAPMGSTYRGMFDTGTKGTGDFTVRESGYLDEYSINFGGNFSDKVYWGLGFGIDDLSYSTETYYTESLTNAVVTDGTGMSTTRGDAAFTLNNWKRITGTGFNVKAGVIVKPINEIRLGLAVHTPTWYSLTQQGVGHVDYNLSTGYPLPGSNPEVQFTDGGVPDLFNWKLQTPWRIMASAAGVVGGKYILSLDYEYRPYQAMTVKNSSGYAYNSVNNSIDNIYRALSIMRLGAEYRITPQVSVRAGYSYQASPVTKEAADGHIAIDTNGGDLTETTQSFSLNDAIQYVTLGVGYRYKGFYIDAAFVHKHESSTYHAFTPAYGNDVNSLVSTPTLAPSSQISYNNNQIVLSVGYKF